MPRKSNLFSNENLTAAIHAVENGMSKKQHPNSLKLQDLPYNLDLKIKTDKNVRVGHQVY